MSVSAFLLDPATKHASVADRVRDAWAGVQRGEYVLSVGLRRLFRDQVHRGEGFSRFKDYAERRFGIPGKLADLFSFVGRHLERLPKTRAAMESGELTYTKAREFVKLATVETEEEWIEFAKGATNRQLERRARRARSGTEEDTTRVVSRLTPPEVQAVRMARESLMKELDRAVPEDKVLPELAETVLAGGPPPSGTAPRRPPGPYLTINLCPRCMHTHVPVPGENLRVPVEDWFAALRDGAEVVDLLSEVLCDCPDARHRRDLCSRSRPTEGPAPRSRHVPASVRRRIEARDGFRCRTPGCGNPVPLEAGHLKPFRDGAPMSERFLCQQCATCNDLIENGRLRVAGEAPFERYHLADETFLGYGFDPDPHVGKSGDPPDPPDAPDPPDPAPGEPRFSPSGGASAGACAPGRDRAPAR
ncbi:MAG: hypothetical protein ACYTDY_01720 [Planctomycetota bacterium]